MSDTPRTEFHIQDKNPTYHVIADLARRLERENVMLREICMGLENEAAAGANAEYRMERVLRAVAAGNLDGETLEEFADRARRVALAYLADREEGK